MTESDLFNYALKNYYNPICRTAEEFSADYNTTTKIRKLLNRYILGEDISFRLLLNHFMMFYNVFHPSAATIILFKKLEKAHYPQIKTIATFLNYIPYNIQDYDIFIDDVEFDKNLVEFLRGI